MHDCYMRACIKWLCDSESWVFYSTFVAVSAAVMDLYSKGTFGKDATQWTKCVVKYLHDNYAEQVQTTDRTATLTCRMKSILLSFSWRVRVKSPNLFQVLPMMTLLAEVLDKGPSFIQQPILQTIYSILQYIDLAVIQTQVCTCSMTRALTSILAWHIYLLSPQPPIPSLPLCSTDDQRWCSPHRV